MAARLQEEGPGAAEHSGGPGGAAGTDLGQASAFDVVG